MRADGGRRLEYAFCRNTERAMRLKTYSGAELREIRKGLGLNQSQFWSHFRITQSGGSRYESGREIPDPVQILLNLAFGPAAKSAAIVEALRQIRQPKSKKKAVSDEAMDEAMAS